MACFQKLTEWSRINRWAHSADDKRRFTGKWNLFRTDTKNADEMLTRNWLVLNTENLQYILNQMSQHWQFKVSLQSLNKSLMSDVHPRKPVLRNVLKIKKLIRFVWKNEIKRKNRVYIYFIFVNFFSKRNSAKKSKNIIYSSHEFLNIK